MKNLSLRRLREIAKLNLIFPPLKFLKRRKKINPKRKYVAEPLLSPEEVKELESKIPSIAINWGILKDGISAKDAADAFASVMQNHLTVNPKSIGLVTTVFEELKAAFDEVSNSCGISAEAFNGFKVSYSSFLEKGQGVIVNNGRIIFLNTEDGENLDWFLKVESVMYPLNRKLEIKSRRLDVRLDLISLKLDMKFDRLTKKYCV